MFHSVTICGKNTWDNYHMVPVEGIYLPTPPEQKITTIDVPTSNGTIDVSTMLTGYPVFNNRSGDLAYYMLDPWDLEEQGIGGALTVDALETRVRKHFSSSYITNFFNNLRSIVYDDSNNHEYFVVVILGTNETQTCITATKLTSVTSNKPYIDGQKIRTATGGNLGYIYLTTNLNFFGCVHQFASGATANPAYDYWATPFSFNNVPTSGSSTSTNTREYCAYPNIPNITRDGSDGTNSWYSLNVYASSSSSTIVYGKTLFKSVAPPALHVTTDPYEVYSQLMSDLHGQTGTMIFEDDPLWEYKGRFSVSSFTTNELRRAVNIHYDVRPYKYKRAETTITLTGAGDSVWSSTDCTPTTLGYMPTNPKVTITGLASATTCKLRIIYPDSTGQYTGNSRIIEKTIGANVTGKTWAEFLFYRNARIALLGTCTATLTFNQGRL